MINALKLEFLFQKRQGLFGIYLFILMFYGIVLSLVPDLYLIYVTPILIFSDPTGIGVFYIGGVLMSEKDQGIPTLIMVTPTHFKTWIASKVISFSITSTVVAFIIYLFGQTPRMNIPLFIFSIANLSVMFTLIGVYAYSISKTLNEYFIKIILPSVLLIIPIAGLFVSKIFVLIPSVMGFQLLLDSLVYGTQALDVIGCMYMLIFNVIFYKIVVQHVLRKVTINGFIET